MSNEFSLEGFTDYYKLKWSKPRLARNLNWYRKAEPTEEFWQWYNGEEDDPDYRQKQKEFLKQNGISIYKEYDNWGLFDWNFKEKGTQEEYDQQQEDREKELCKVLLQTLIDRISSEPEKTFLSMKKELERCDTVEELEDYAYSEIVGGIGICKKAQHEFSLL